MKRKDFSMRDVNEFKHELELVEDELSEAKHILEDIEELKNNLTEIRIKLVETQQLIAEIVSLVERKVDDKR